MKLISCHIRNFGMLSNKDYVFKDGINSFIEDNGSGKSTLASFIKAMLFGMEQVRASDVEFKDRRHYAPFNEQSYGGTLVFEHNGKEYRIERTFDVKSSVKDELVIYVDKIETSFDHEIGEEILGLDKESFERLLFIESKDIKMQSSGNIRKNLNNIIDDSIEGVDFESIINTLSEISKKYSGRKGSALSELKEKKKELEGVIHNQEIISSSLNEKYIRRNALKNDLDSLEKQQEQLSKQIAIKECWDNYNSSLNTINGKKDYLKGITDLYTNGYPSGDELEELEQLERNKIELLGKAKGISFNENKLFKLSVLKNTFSKGIPSEEDVLTIENKIEERNRLNTLLDAESQQLSDEENSIFNRFKGKDHNADLAKVETLINEYKELEESVKITPRVIESNVQEKKANNKLTIILLIAAFLLIGTGIAMFFVLLALGIALTSVGVITLLVSGFLYLKNRIDSSNNVVSQTNNDYLKVESQLRNKIEEVHQVLTPYGIYTQSIYSDYEKFKSELSRYKEIVNKKEQASSSNDVKKASIIKLEEEISTFLKIYLVNDKPVSNIQELKDLIKEYKNLSSEYDSYNLAKKTNEDELNKINNSLKAIDDKYDLGLLNQRRTLEQIKNDISTITRMQKEIADGLVALNKYKEEKDLGDEEPIFDTLDYSNQIKSMSYNLHKLESEIDNDELEIENMDDNKEALASINKSIADANHKADILDKLNKELHNAQKVLDDKYVAPIMDKFEFYSKLLGDVLGIKIEMGRDFDIKLNFDGILRSDEHLSSGQRSICALCFRLALLDNIYNNDTPFIIMDDPFVSLDDKNLKSTFKMLEKLSKDKQIIYFSCHPSRAI